MDNIDWVDLDAGNIKSEKATSSKERPRPTLSNLLNRMNSESTLLNRIDELTRQVAELTKKVEADKPLIKMIEATRRKNLAKFLFEHATYLPPFGLTATSFDPNTGQSSVTGASYVFESDVINDRSILTDDEFVFVYGIPKSTVDELVEKKNTRALALANVRSKYFATLKNNVKFWALMAAFVNGPDIAVDNVSYLGVTVNGQQIAKLLDVEEDWIKKNNML